MAQNQPSAELAEAFRLFNDLSEQLAAAYRDLEARVAVLTEELAAARGARMRELAEKERLAGRLARLLEVLPVAVLVLDAEGRVVQHNPAAERFLGLVPAGRRWAELAAGLRPASADGRELATAGGRRLSLARAALADGGRILVLHDVTETRRLEAQAARQARLADLGEVTARIAHQLRTPLAAALLQAGHLARDDLEPALRRRIAGRLQERLRALEGRIAGLLRFARGVPEAGGEALFDAVAAAREAAAEAAGFGRPRVAVRAPAGEALVRGRREALVEALANLVDNAREAGAAEVTLTVGCADGWVTVEVADDGPGVPAEARERLFEPFFTTRPDGTGLGLAVVRAVARAHGGEAAYVGGPGARFVLRLPQATAAEPLAGGAVRMAKAGRRR
ncbi:sensor histidine kinase [Inmirania thermothiophila]|uniref:histidine kinase n=1 Tax=Inmirania thermothiophila TaxID=1750597 RepID=A0A3N1Y7W8_9GAMM|nr:ATP-binding protein [Inmirania thermothiophila]ROR34926.1 PAS/PAC sensor signal transduction histidine kinase [Inmirania thermothiophila]